MEEIRLFYLGQRKGESGGTDPDGVNKRETLYGRIARYGEPEG